MSRGRYDLAAIALAFFIVIVFLGCVLLVCETIIRAVEGV